MDIVVSFPGGQRVDAVLGPFTVHTDQPIVAGGDASAPAPFDLFLTSLATCAGLYVVAFCRARAIPTEGISLVQHVEVDPETHLPRAIRQVVRLPASFPEKYRAAIARAAEGCKVKKAIASAPHIEVTAVVDDAIAA
jgi:putative redox protein